MKDMQTDNLKENCNNCMCLECSFCVLESTNISMNKNTSFANSATETIGHARPVTNSFTHQFSKSLQYYDHASYQTTAQSCCDDASPCDDLATEKCPLGCKISNPIHTVLSTNPLGSSNCGRRSLDDGNVLKEAENSNFSGSSSVPNTSVRQHADWKRGASVLQEMEEPCELIEVKRYSVFADARTGEFYAMVYDSFNAEDTCNLTDTEKNSLFQRQESLDSTPGLLDMSPVSPGCWSFTKLSPTEAGTEGVSDFNDNICNCVLCKSHNSLESFWEFNDVCSFGQAFQENFGNHDHGEAQILHNTSEAQILHNTSEAQILHNTSEAQILHNTSEAQILHSTSEAQILHNTSEAQILHNTSEAQILHNTSEAQILHSTSEAQILHNTSEAQILHNTSEAQILHNTSEAQILHNTSEAQILHSTSEAQILHNTSEAQILYNTSEAQILHNTLPGTVQTLRAIPPNEHVHPFSGTTKEQAQSFPDTALSQNLPSAVSFQEFAPSLNRSVSEQRQPSSLAKNCGKTRHFRNDHTEPKQLSRSYQEPSTFNIKSKPKKDAHIPTNDHSFVMQHPLTHKTVRSSSDPPEPTHLIQDDSSTSKLTGKSYISIDELRELYSNRRGFSVNYLNLEGMGILTPNKMKVDKNGSCVFCRRDTDKPLCLKGVIPIRRSTSTGAGTNQSKTATSPRRYEHSLSSYGETKHECYCENENNSPSAMQTPSQRLLSSIGCNFTYSHTQSLSSSECLKNIYQAQNRRNQCEPSTCSSEAQPISTDKIEGYKKCDTKRVSGRSSEQQERKEIVYRGPVANVAANAPNRTRQINYLAYLCCAEDNLQSFGLPFHRKLEEWGLRIFIAARDLELGGSKFDNMAKCVEERCNGKVIVILSKSYSQSEECLFLTYFAKALDPDSKRKNIIPVVIDKEIEVPSVLHGLSFINYNYVCRNNWLKPKIISALAA